VDKKKAKKAKEKIKRGLYGVRLTLPSNKRHKTKKDYKRKNKVSPNEAAED
jgi:hypothetical protein